MAKEGTKPFYTKAEVDALLAAHSADYTKHVKVIRKTADQTVNNSDTLQDDDELFFPIAANEVWAFILLLIENSSQTADFKIALTVPSGATLSGGVVTEDTEGGLGTVQLSWEPELYLCGDAQDYAPLPIIGVIINGATAGNLQLQWAQHTAEESDTIVRANSCLLAWKLA